MVEKVIKMPMFFEKGTIPLIFSVPHGGSLRCKEIPERENGIFGIDKGTIEIARKLCSIISSRLKIKENNEKSIPSLIISNLKRSQIDLNRDEHEAFNSNSKIAKKLYHFYHDKIREFISYNLKYFGISLLIDIHGFEKHKRPAGFRDVDIVLGTNNLNSISNTPIPRKDWDKNIRGMLIKKFLEHDIPIAPGHPRRREYVLTGGYITQIHGASSINNSQAIQVEFSDKIRIHYKKYQQEILEIMATAIIEYLDTAQTLKIG
ncbi:MAG: hypothetical protein ACTSU4_12295 [Promethearchaeota archaeon]